MNILLSSYFFHPSVGGIESVGFVLAGEFVKAGHEVQVVTQTRVNDGKTFEFKIHRCPKPLQLIKLVRWCDVFFHNNISLKSAWPLLFVKRPWVIAHHTWIARVNGRQGIRDCFKQYLLRNATNIAISSAVESHLKSPSVRIGNPYNNSLFKLDPAVTRDLELVFLGRLVWDKGVDLLLDALCLLKREKGLTPHLTIIGDGKERQKLEQQANQLGLSSRIRFAGTLTGNNLVTLLNRHKIMVIPSRWQEPFGLIALEGIACGCIIIGANCGGLSDAIGPCGITFPCNNVAALSNCIGQLLVNETNHEQYRIAAPEHLFNHTADEVAHKYLVVIEKAVKENTY